MTNKLKCDLCGCEYLVAPVHKMAAFRNVRNLCYNHNIHAELIRSRHAHDAYKYGRKDWLERMDKNVKRELKNFYRKHEK